LGDYVEDIIRQVPSGFAEPLVVAHSGAGVVLPAAALALGARYQVWLAAFVPDGRRSFLEEVPPSPADVFNPEWLGKDPTSDPVLATYFLFHDCDLATLRWALSTLRLFSPQRLYEERVALVPEIPSVYVVASQDRTLRPDWCRREAPRRLDAQMIDIDAGHCPHVSRPDEIAVLLNNLAVGSQT
jgi:pimeloyl-ACP methyl ester carboxylesterase